MKTLLLESPAFTLVGNYKAALTTRLLYSARTAECWEREIGTLEAKVFCTNRSNSTQLCEFTFPHICPWNRAVVGLWEQSCPLLGFDVGGSGVELKNSKKRRVWHEEKMEEKQMGIITERDERFCVWLHEVGLSGYVEAFLDLQRNSPQVLAGFDDNDWADIFLRLPPPKDGEDLAALFSALSVQK